VYHVPSSNEIHNLEFNLFQIGMLVVFLVKLWRFIRNELKK
jgi:hypothetical protein